jgi:hypothetical protein
MQFCTYQDMLGFCPRMAKESSGDCCVPWACCEHPLDWRSRHKWCLLFDLCFSEKEYRSKYGEPYAALDFTQPLYIFTVNGIKLYPRILEGFKQSSMQLSDFRRLAGLNLK